MNPYPPAFDTVRDAHLYIQIARAHNTLDASLYAPILADDVVYESQSVFSALEGKEKVLEYLAEKFETIRSYLPESRLFAELGFHGSYPMAPRTDWLPCIVVAQGDSEDVSASVLLTISDGLIKRIDICTVVPSPDMAFRTGIYPE